MEESQKGVQNRLLNHLPSDSALGGESLRAEMASDSKKVKRSDGIFQPERFPRASIRSDDVGLACCRGPSAKQALGCADEGPLLFGNCLVRDSRMAVSEPLNLAVSSPALPLSPAGSKELGCIPLWIMPHNEYSLHGAI
jgi:hypothetical protein